MNASKQIGSHSSTLKYLHKMLSPYSLRLYEIGSIILNDLNVKYGDTILVDKSYKQILNSDFDPEDLIYFFKVVVGSRGIVKITSFNKQNGSNFDFHNYFGLPGKRKTKILQSIQRIIILA